MDRPFTAYKGNEPYIFVSYAHENAAVVYPELEWLKDQGFNIWYDEGVSPGSEWRTELADAIVGCSLFLYFVTPRSVASEHCIRESSFAIDHKAQLLTVYLEEATLPSGLELSIGSTQSILRYELSEHEYRLKLLQGTSDHIYRGVASSAGEGRGANHRQPKHAMFGAVGGLLLGIVATILVAMATGWLSLQEAGEPVLREELAAARSAISSLNSKIATVDEDYRKLREAHQKSMSVINAPVQVFPPVGSHVFGDSVTLEWTYSDDSLKDDFVIQISPVSIGESKNRRGINKKEMKYYYVIADGEHGEYLWRLKKGDTASENNWSQWGHFTTYRSAVERLSSRGELVVATVPSYAGPFTYRVNEEIVGFDIELVKWLGNQLGEQLGIPDLKITIVESGWEELFLGVESQRFDLGIASISNSVGRKNKYKKLRFSDGYIDVNPVLISLEEKDIPKDLYNSIVGVTYDTTNELAARSLVDKYGITVDAETEYYTGLRDKLSSGEISFAIVDDIIFGPTQDSGFYQYDLTSILKDSGYLEESFQGENEEYAIAVVFEPREEDDLLDRINGILRSPTGIAKLKEMKASLVSGEEWGRP